MVLCLKDCEIAGILFEMLVVMLQVLEIIANFFIGKWALCFCLIN